MKIINTDGGVEMNELSKKFVDINNGATVVLEKNKIYDVRQDDSFEIEGYYCSNTAKKHENPNGLRRTAIFLENKNNITIDGNGATLLVHGKMTPLLFNECENITVRNLTVDYACPTMSEFKILSNNNGECVIKINPECRFRIEGNEIIWQGENGADGKPYWEGQHAVRGRYIKIFDPENQMSKDFRREDSAFEKIEQINENTLKVTLENKDAPFVEGCIIQNRSIVRDQTGSLFQRCKNLNFENLRIKFMHGLGMVSQFCDNVTFRNCDLTPAEGRTIASTADFFQFSGCRGNLTVENCRAWGAHDDYINVHGTHLRIVERKDNSLVVRFMHNESWGFQAFAEGDELEFIKWNTLIPFGKATVKSFERLNDTDIKLLIEGNIPEIELEKDVVENATWTPNLYVRNCDFGPTSGRGILCTTRGEVIIENNNFHNLWGPALLIEDDCNFWFESGYTKEIIFRNNRVSNCEFACMWEGAPSIRYTPKVMDENSEAPVHGRLVLKDNIFEKPHFAEHLIWLDYVEEAEISGNKFDAPYKIRTNCVKTVTDTDNTVC